MGTESGQELACIIRRKEFERRIGGTFWWGIGTSLGDAPRRAALEHGGGETLPVIWSAMRSKPQRHDAEPSAVLAWTEYLTAEGVRAPVPPHALVISRPKKDGSISSKYQALVCATPDDLLTQFSRGFERPFDHLAYRTFDAGKPVGQSQTTAIARRSAPSGSQPQYRADMRATLVGPLVVTMQRPVIMSAAALAELARWSLMDPNQIDAGEWRAFVASVVNTAPQLLEPAAP